MMDDITEYVTESTEFGDVEPHKMSREDRMSDFRSYVENIDRPKEYVEFIIDRIHSIQNIILHASRMYFL
jgi:hypothetical protein